MYFLKEKLGTITSPFGCAATYALVLSKLKDLNLSVQTVDQNEGILVVACLTRLVSARIWQCWSDKLLLQVKGIDPNATLVSIFGIPNLLRVKTKPSETVTDVKALVSQIADACR